MKSIHRKYSNRYLINYTSFRFFTTFLLLIFGNVLTLNAQSPTCSYDVHNGISCNVFVKLDYYDGTTNCHTVSSTLIGPNSVSVPSFNCGSCTNITNIVVTILDIAGVTLPASSNAWVDINNQTKNITHPSGSSNFFCGNVPSVDIQWNSNAVIITVGP